MRDVPENAELVACCGLYCGACPGYRKERCDGCRKNERAGWCKVRACCGQKQIATCADCAEYPNPSDCKKFNNFISKLIGIVFNSDRAACIAHIRALGLEGHAKAMAGKKLHTIRRRGG